MSTTYASNLTSTEHRIRAHTVGRGPWTKITELQITSESESRKVAIVYRNDGYPHHGGPAFFAVAIRERGHSNTTLDASIESVSLAANNHGDILTVLQQFFSCEPVADIGGCGWVMKREPAKIERALIGMWGTAYNQHRARMAEYQQRMSTDALMEQRRQDLFARYKLQRTLAAQLGADARELRRLVWEN